MLNSSETKLQIIKLALPYMSDVELQLDIKELKLHIQDLENQGGSVTYFKEKLAMLEDHLKERHQKSTHYAKNPKESI